MSNLKNCPFCNGTHSINVINFFTADSFRKCDICGAEAPEAKTPEEAAKVWNTRPAEDAKDREIDNLKRALQQIVEIASRRGHLTVETLQKDAWYGLAKIAKEALGKDTNVPANAPDTGKMEG